MMPTSQRKAIASQLRMMRADTRDRIRGLAAAHRPLGDYAMDLISAFLRNDGTELEAGDLFRTLVLDEGWSVDQAAEVYRLATSLAKE